jgi:hypothetical protein
VRIAVFRRLRLRGRTSDTNRMLGMASLQEEIEAGTGQEQR